MSSPANRVNAARKGTGRYRAGSALVEFALVAPFFFLLVFGLVEAARLVMVCVTLSYAAHEGCRTGIAAGSTTADVQQAIEAALRTGFLSNVEVSISPSEVASAMQGTPITVRLRVPLSGVSWLPLPQFIGNRVAMASCTLSREGR